MDKAYHATHCAVIFFLKPTAGKEIRTHLFQNFAVHTQKKFFLFCLTKAQKLATMVVCCVAEIGATLKHVTELEIKLPWLLTIDAKNVISEFSQLTGRNMRPEITQPLKGCSFHPQLIDSRAISSHSCDLNSKHLRSHMRAMQQKSGPYLFCLVKACWG